MSLQSNHYPDEVQASNVNPAFVQPWELGQPEEDWQEFAAWRQKVEAEEAAAIAGKLTKPDLDFPEPPKAA